MEDDELVTLYRRILPRYPDAPPFMTFCGITEHVRGSVIISGTTRADGDMRFIAQPLQPWKNLDDPVDMAALERLRREVVGTTHYVDYQYEEEDD